MVVLRDGDGGLEAFCVRRSAQSTFLGGALVFPGGKVDPSDSAGDWDDRVGPVHPRALELADTASAARALLIAACRETLEEGAILPVNERLDAALALTLREELVAKAPLAGALARRGLRLSLDALVPWSRWVTPEAESRRYDARFFLLALPEGQQGEHDSHETTMSMWARPLDVLEMAVRGEVFLAPPTTRTLELLAEANDVEAALALAGQQCLRPICPRFVLANEDGAPYLALPGDPSHDVRERRTEGPSRFVLRGGRFVSEEVTDSPDLAR